VSDVGDRCPDRLGGLAVRLGPEFAAGNTDPLEDADILVRKWARQAAFGRWDDPRVHTQQALDHRVAAGLLGNLPDHRVERILPMLGPTARKSPVGLALR
jgi:hypothetical protein